MRSFARCRDLVVPLKEFVMLPLWVCLALGAGPTEDWHQPESVRLKYIRQLTSDFVRAGEGYFSPDMKQIIFQAEEKEGGNPFYQIFVMDLDTGKYRRISPGIGRTTCSYFSPDGRKVIFASSHLDPDARKHQAEEYRRRAEDRRAGRHRNYQWDFDPYMEIFEANSDGSGLKRLTDAQGYDAEGSYSPDGRHIVFCSGRDGNLELYVMDADGKHVRHLTHTPGCYNGGPFFSPDGKRVVFRSDRKKKDYLQLYVINADGTGERALTDNEGVNWGPYWYPDGKHIVYAAADHSNPAVRPNYDLWWMNVDTGKKVRLTYAPAADVLPVFSPDGKKLMWTSTRTADHSSQLFIADFVAPEDDQ
jgi:Tol biopolymer transport system component